MTSYRIVRHITLFVQKILVDSNHQEFDMKQRAKNMLFALYYLTWLVYFHPITLFLTLQRYILELMRLMLRVLKQLKQCKIF